MINAVPGLLPAVAQRIVTTVEEDALPFLNMPIEVNNVKHEVHILASQSQSHPSPILEGFKSVKQTSANYPNDPQTIQSNEQANAVSMIQNKMICH